MDLCEDQTIFFGPPGTGKTEKLIETAQQEIRNGVPPYRIAYSSFTRRGAYEARDRAAVRFKLAPKDMPYFRTLHSLAYHALGLQASDVMTTEDYEGLGEELGLDFRGDYDDIEYFPLVETLGDRVARIEGLSRIQAIPLEQAWHEANLYDLPFSAVEKYADALYSFKRQRNILDFIDFIDLYNERSMALPVDVVIIDEAQDNSRQQWLMIANMCRNAARVYIGGDDDQAIFRWAGADVETFLSLGGRRQVLDHSYRVPASGHKLASDVSSRIITRYPKTWSPRKEAGDVIFLPDFYDIDISSGTWLCLARNAYLLPRLEKFVRHFGYAYTIQGRSSLDSDYVRAALYWEALRKGDQLDRKQARAIARSTTWLEAPRSEGPFVLSDIWKEDAPAPDWMAALDRLSSEVREYIRAVKRNGESLVDRPRIAISTIHGVKGAQADHVIILRDMSKRSWDAMNVNGDDENRVFYVGLTRFKKTMYVIEPKTLRYFEL